MISASMVKELRNSTGAGMMDCKKALVEADGNMAKAIDILREKGLSQAAKKASRIAAEGAVVSYISENGKIGVDRKSTRLNSSHSRKSRMPSSA